VAARDGPTASISSLENPAGMRKRTRSPAGVFSNASTLGIWPCRLITPQLMRTSQNQRRQDWSRNFLARRVARPGILQSAMPAAPTKSTPIPSPSMKVPTCQSTRMDMVRITSNPHPRTANAIRE